MFTQKSFKALAIAMVAVSFTGCAWLTDYQYVPPGEEAKAAPAEKPAKLAVKEAEPAPAAPAVNNDDVYLIEHEGRLYVFDDEKIYASFMQHGETAYRLVRIGAGPGGATLVFGLRDEDKAKQTGIASVDMYEGRLAGAAENFFAIVLHDNRFYVFSEWNDLVSFQQTRSADLRFTEIGAGPGGRTVVYVLNEGNKKDRPVALIERFHGIHNQ